MNGRQMPWGKHRGEWIEDLPESYLRWIVGDKCFVYLPEGTQSYIKNQLKELDKTKSHENTGTK